MTLPLDSIERALARLWEDEARRSGAPRIELMTLVALVAERSLVERARTAMADFVRDHPSRTILATWSDACGDAIAAEAALHRIGDHGAACGDAIELAATGGGRDWLPDNVERLALPDLPVCLWWVGDLSDFDPLFDRMVPCADVAVVDSAKMDLRDLCKLSDVVDRSRDRVALGDLGWIRLRPVRELVARFFDDESSRAHLRSLHRVTIEFSPHDRSHDVASTQAGLLFGWMANALGIGPESVTWKAGEGWAEATCGGWVGRFEQRSRPDLDAGAILRVAIDCGGARFHIERQEDPCVFRWTRQVPGCALPSQTLRLGKDDDSMLLARGLATPRRDPLLEASLHFGSRIVRRLPPPAHPPTPS